MIWWAAWRNCGKSAAPLFGRFGASIGLQATYRHVGPELEKRKGVGIMLMFKDACGMAAASGGAYRLAPQPGHNVGRSGGLWARRVALRPRYRPARTLRAGSPSGSMYPPENRIQRVGEEHQKNIPRNTRSLTRRLSDRKTKGRMGEEEQKNKQYAGT